MGDILIALEDAGAALDATENGFVWLSAKSGGCYVRTRHVQSIELCFRKSQPFAEVRLRSEDGSFRTVLDERTPKQVRRAVERAEMEALERVLDAVSQRFARVSHKATRPDRDAGTAG